MTSCFVYKVMGLNFHDRINTQLIRRFELAQVVARWITKPQRFFLGSNLTGCSFFIQFFVCFIYEGGGAGSDFIILFMSYFFFFLFLFFYYYHTFFIPLTCIRHIYKTSVTTKTTLNSEICANSYSDPPPPPLRE